MKLSVDENNMTIEAIVIPMQSFKFVEALNDDCYNCHFRKDCIGAKNCSADTRKDKKEGYWIKID